MLQAVLSGKAGRIEQGGESLSWRELFKRSEDLLTATVFGRLPYLSDSAFKAVLGRLIGPAQAEQLSPFVQMELWPHLTEWEERSYVEPDVILRFESELVMVEVKPPFGGGQYQEQWRAQMTALSVETEYLEYERVHFVALGNTLPAPLPMADHPERFAPMTQLEWNELRSLLQEDPVFAGCRQDNAICQDWMEAFGLFGMLPMLATPPEWPSLFEYSKDLELAAACQWLSSTCPIVPAENHWSPLLACADGLALDRQLLATCAQ